MIEPDIREAKSDDVESVLPLVKEFVASFELDPDVFRRSFQKLIDDDTVLVLVAETGGAHLSALATRRAATFYEVIGYNESATYYRRLL